MVVVVTHREEAGWLGQIPPLRQAIVCSFRKPLRGGGCDSPIEVVWGEDYWKR